MSNAEERLKELACGEFALSDLADLDNPNWAAGRFHWEQYVPYDLKPLWQQLSSEARLVAYICASEVCSSDDLDFD